VSATGGKAGRPLGAVFALGLIALLWLAAPSSAGAATIVPDVLTDDFTPDTECSLREAVQVANTDSSAVEDDCAVTGTLGADTITLASGTYQLGPDNAFDEDASPDDNAQGDIDIGGLGVSQPLTIDGQGPAATTINAAAIMPPVRALHFLNSNGQMALEDLRITGGHPVGAVLGGGILADSSTSLAMLRTTVDTNSAQFGGGVSAQDLTVTDSTISGNGATSSGGGIRAFGELAINGTTTVSGNNAPQGGGIAYASGTESIEISGDVVVSNNTATGGGGGLSVQAQGGMTTTISGATFDDNHASSGGGIHFDAIGDESISLTGVTVENNDAQANGGGLVLADDATITNSEIADNVARETVDDGVAEGQGGGGIYSAGDLVVEDTWIHDNEASSADPNDSLSGGGILNATGADTIRRSTVSDNQLGPVGVGRMGAGIAGSSTSITRVENSTLFGNVANGAGSQGGALYQSPATTTMVVAHSTMAGNSAATAPAIFNNGSLTLSGSILAGGVTGCGGGGSTTANAYNIDFGTTCVGAANDTDLESTNPQLGALAANGGPTLTMLPIPASPAVDAVPAASCRDALGAPLALDQRGLGRPDDGNANGQYDCEAGAVELQVSGPKPADPAIQPPGTAKKCKKAKKKKKKKRKKKCGKKKRKKKRFGSLSPASLRLPAWMRSP
jgi:CSLREA domain-containing protein